MLYICISFNFPKHFCVVRKLQHLACYVIIQIIDIYIKNKIGPSTDPCGTPLKTDFQFETSPSTTTLCLLSISHFSIQLIIPFPMPWAFSLSSSLWCGTLSKAFLKSKWIISTGDPSSTHFVTSSKKHKVFVKHYLAFKNPC